MLMIQKKINKKEKKIIGEKLKTLIILNKEWLLNSIYIHK
jgi:hypothetical protein